MKFSCEKKDLVKTLNAISKAVVRCSLSILEGVHIETGEDCVKLTCNNLDFALTATIPATVTENGKAVIAVGGLRKLAKKMTGNTLTITTKIEIKSPIADAGGPSILHLVDLSDDYAHLTLIGMDADDYPKIPEFAQTKEISIPQCTLRSMLEQTLYAVAKNDSRPIHMGVLFNLAGGKLNLVSVDGYRLALRRENVDSREDVSFVIPGLCLSNMVKLLSEKDNTDAKLRTDGKNIIIEFGGGYTVFSRLLDGDFMDYKNAIPNSSDKYVIVPVKRLCEAVGRAIEISGNKSRYNPLRMEFGANGINLAINSQSGEYSEDVGCESFGIDAGMTMGTNARFLMDVLKVLDCDKLRVEFGTEFSPMKFVPTDGAELFLHLLIPSKLKNTQAA